MFIKIIILKLALMLHRLEYRIPDEIFDNARKSPGHRNMKIELPYYIDDVVSIGHKTSIFSSFNELLYQIWWFMKIFVSVSTNMMNMMKRRRLYVPSRPNFDIDFRFDNKTNILYLEVVTAIHRKSYQNIIIMYSSKVEDRNKVLEKLGI